MFDSQKSFWKSATMAKETIKSTRISDNITLYRFTQQCQRNEWHNDKTGHKSQAYAIKLFK